MAARHHLTLDEYRSLYRRKPALRAIYEDYYRRVGTWLRAGPTVELGAGGAELRRSLPQAFATDIVRAPWLDLVLDAHELPLQSGAIGNLIGVDVLHHLERPREFLAEASRVLRPGGRVVFVEPAITPVSWVVFKLTHPEPVILREDPLAITPRGARRDPMDSNQAVPTLLVGRHRDRFARAFPDLEVAHRERLSLVAYPLTGGYRRWSLLPPSAVAPMLKAEEKAARVCGRLMAFRLLIVLQRKGREVDREDDERRADVAHRSDRSALPGH